MPGLSSEPDDDALALPTGRNATARRQRLVGPLLLIVALALVASAGVRLYEALPRLIHGPGKSAIDLRFRYKETHLWFAGQPVYGAVPKGDYPPASYAILWPLLGWLTYDHARWLWAATTIAALVALSCIAVRGSRAQTYLQQAVAAGLLVGVYPTSVTVRVGQIGIHLLVAVVAGLLLFGRRTPRLWSDILAAGLVAASLAKPTSAAPLVWIVCFAFGRVRPIVLVVAWYAALTLLADWFQEPGLADLIRLWLEQAQKQVDVRFGQANLHKWLLVAGLGKWQMAASLAVFAGLGIWTWRNRRADLWLLMGVAAVVTRIWAHHRLHDDVLLWVAMIALFRLAIGDPASSRGGRVAPLLMVMTWAPMLLPARVFLHGTTMAAAIEYGQSAVWLVVLGYLAYHARRSHACASHDSPSQDSPSQDKGVCS